MYLLLDRVRRGIGAPMPAALVLLVTSLPAGAQVLPAGLLDRIAAVELLGSQQSNDLLSVTNDLTGLRAAVTTLGNTSSDQARLLGLSIADIDALSLDVAGLRSTLGTIDVDILSKEARDDGQDEVLADHERRITTNTTNIAATNRTVAVHTVEIAAHTVEIAALRGDTDDNTRRLDGHDRDIAALRRDFGSQMQDVRDELDAQGERIDTATEGVAMAFALNGPAVAADKSFALSGGFGHFEGHNAFAVSGGIRASEAVQFDGGLAVGLESGSVGGRAGATISW